MSHARETTLAFFVMYLFPLMTESKGKEFAPTWSKLGRPPLGVISFL